MNTVIFHLRWVGLLEGISFLLLLLVCMPLKYMYQIPEPTQLVGMAHGVLFILYVVLVIMAYSVYNWSVKTLFLALVASVLPFGTFVADKKLFALNAR